jgi:hypothetical protein
MNPDERMRSLSVSSRIPWSAAFCSSASWVAWWRPNGVLLEARKNPDSFRSPLESGLAVIVPSGRNARHNTER